MTKNLLVILTIVWLIFVSDTAGAQVLGTVDSLKALISATPSSRLDTLFDNWDQVIREMEPKNALNLALNTLQAAKKSDNTLAQVLACSNVAGVYNISGNKAEALKYYQEAIAIAKSDPKEHYGTGISMFNLGLFLSEQFLWVEGLQYILQASKIFQGMKKTRYIILCHSRACTIHYRVRNYQHCIEEGYQVISILEKLSPSESTADDELQKMSIYNTVALANRALKQYDMAFINFDKAEELARKLKNEFWIGLIEGNRAVILKNLGRNDEALTSLQADFEISKKFKEWGSAGAAALMLSELYLTKHEFIKAQHYLDSGQAMFEKDTDIMSVKKGIASYWLAAAKIKAETGEYIQAYAALAKHIALRDSLDHELQSLNIANIKASYDLDQKQSEIEILTKNNEIQQERIRSQQTLFAATLVGLILLIILVVSLIYNFWRQRNTSELVRLQHNEIEEKNMELEAQSMQLQENNQYIQSLNTHLEQKVAERTIELEVAIKELDTFLYRSSHDIRRPITTLLGLDQVARHVVKDSQANMLFDKVVETARHMDNMLFKMQMVYELNKPAPELEPVDLNLLLEEIIKSFKPDFDRFSISNHISMADDISILSSPSLLRIIFRNLIENAILFRKTQPGAEPFIDLSIKKVDAHVEIVIADNGIGMEEKYHHQIFNLYFRASQVSKGNGLGLYLVRKALDKLNGSIRTLSDYGIGTTFTIILPGVASSMH